MPPFRVLSAALLLLLAAAATAPAFAAASAHHREGGPSTGGRRSRPMDASPAAANAAAVLATGGGFRIQAQPPVGADMFRRKKVSQMMQHSWTNHTGTMDRNFLVSALSTLYTMRLPDEYAEARAMVDELIHEQTDFTPINYVANWVSDAIGGMLSAHALTGDPRFRHKVAFMMDRPIPTLNASGGIPRSHFSRETNNTALGGYLLETLYVEKISVGYNVLTPVALDVRRFLWRERRPLIFSMDLYVLAEEDWVHSFSGNGIGSTPQYRIHDDLLRVYLATGGRDREIGMLLDEYVSSALASVQRSDEGGRYFVSGPDGKMYHASCSLGAFLAVLSVVRYPGTAGSAHLMQLAVGITDTCRAASVLFGHIDPIAFTVNARNGTIDLGDAPRQQLGFATALSYLTLWRLTHNETYRNWGWDSVIGLETLARHSNGYLDSTGESWSWFPGATLKYLYLLFSDDADLSLDEWVFNRCGHPFPM